MRGGPGTIVVGDIGHSSIHEIAVNLHASSQSTARCAWVDNVDTTPTGNPIQSFIVIALLNPIFSEFCFCFTSLASKPSSTKLIRRTLQTLVVVLICCNDDHSEIYLQALLKQRRRKEHNSPREIQKLSPNKKRTRLKMLNHLPVDQQEEYGGQP